MNDNSTKWERAAISLAVAAFLIAYICLFYALTWILLAAGWHA
ncbi:hypothetical protein [Antrihabitans cavernicola]|nr:hypothetical protein [Spelaeibacter cavernicola]